MMANRPRGLLDLRLPAKEIAMNENENKSVESESMSTEHETEPTWDVAETSVEELTVEVPKELPLVAKEPLEVWRQFLEALKPQMVAHRVTVDEKSQWVVLHGRNGHKIAIQKTRDKLPRVETSLDLPANLPEVVEKITMNGRMKTALEPHPDIINTAIEMLSDKSNPIPAKGAKRGAKTAPPALADLLSRTL